MATTARFGLTHSLALILLSFLFLPINSCILFCSYVLQSLNPRLLRRPSRARDAGFRTRRILVSGVNTANGLTLARILYQAGHHIVGADCQANHVPGIARVSKAVKSFHALPTPRDEIGTTDYVHALLQVVEKEQAELWVSCSSFTSAIEDSLAREVIERKTNCRCLQFDMRITSILSNKGEFLQLTRSMGLPTHEAYNVTSRHEVHKVLGVAANSSKSFTISKNRSRQTDEDKRHSWHSSGDISPVFPRRTVSETYQMVSEIPISQDTPHVLEEDINGEEYLTHSLVVRDCVETFAACATPTSLLHVRELPASSGLHQAMLKFTQEFVSRFDYELTGNISLTFKIRETSTEKAYERRLIPTTCSPRVELPSILLRSANKKFSQAVVNVLNAPASNGHVKPSENLPALEHPLTYHWTGQDLISLIVLPTLSLLSGHIGPRELFRGYLLFLHNVLFWKDVMFELWDPLPWWWLYHVYWPMQLLFNILHRQKWTSIDMSTGQIYE